MIWPAFIMGLAGSLHCAGMCGPLALALPASPGRRFHLLAGRLGYNLGRVITYTMLGVIFGLFGETLVLAGWQRGLSLAVGGVLLLYLALRLSPRRQAGLSAFIASLIGPLQRTMGRLLQRDSVAAQLVFGILNGFLPCGLVYLALAGAAASGSAAGGALFMAVFGLGTAPMMLALSLCGSLLHAGLRLRLQRAVPYLMAGLAVLFILRGLSLAIPYLSPRLTAGEPPSCCH